MRGKQDTGGANKQRVVSSAAGSAAQLAQQNQEGACGGWTGALDDWDHDQRAQSRSPTRQHGPSVRQRDTSGNRARAESPLKFNFTTPYRQVAPGNKAQAEDQRKKGRPGAGGEGSKPEHDAMEMEWENGTDDYAGNNSPQQNGTRRSPPTSVTPEGPTERFAQVGTETPGSRSKWNDDKERALCFLWQNERHLYDSTL